MGEDIKVLRRNASSADGTEEYLDYLIELLKNAETKTVLSSQGYQTIIVPDTKLLEEIAFLKAEDGEDLDSGLSEHESQYQREELAALRIEN